MRQRIICRRQSVTLVLLVLVLLVSCGRSEQSTELQTDTGCTSAPEAPGPADQAQAGSTGELSIEQKHAAFDAVLAGKAGYGDYRFPLAVTQNQQTSFYPLLLKSVAGIESQWTQYEQGQTLVNQSCDFGLLQLNELARTNLFAKQPSLRSDTRGNIAAGAQALSELWAQGLFGTLPLVNDADPTWLPNWYYALSAYNAGPSGDVWINNPACGGVLICLVDKQPRSYFFSRPTKGLADWVNLGPELYPYQERVLYNLPFPRQLDQHPATGIREWQAAGLGFKAITAQGETGLRPEDAVFVRRDPSSGELVSFAPNLLLFQHRATPVRSDLNAQAIYFEYDLPFSAQVTLTLQLQDGSERPLCAHPSKAGWNLLICRATVPLQLGDAYRIRAERGSPEQPADYYLGQYLQAFTVADGPQQVQSLAPVAFLPLVQNTGRSAGLLNPAFVAADPNQGWKPDYWEAQVLFSRQPGATLPVVSKLMQRSSAPLGWQLNAVPGALADLRQRISLEPGSYLLKVQLDVVAKDVQSVLSIRTRPAAPGPQPWSLVANIAAEQSGPQELQYRLTLNGPTTLSLLASFGPQDSQSAFILRSVELFR